MRFAQIPDGHLIENIRRTYASGGLCARYYPLQDVKIVRRPNPRQADSVIALLALKIMETPQIVSMNDGVELAFCFGGGNAQQISDIGRVKRIVASVRFELGPSGWTISRFEWNPPRRLCLLLSLGVRRRYSSALRLRAGLQLISWALERSAYAHRH